MKDKMIEEMNKMISIVKRFLPHIIIAVLVIIFSYLTFLTLFIREDIKIKTEGEKRVDTIERIQFDKNTLNELLVTPEPTKIEGQGGKNPFLPF